MNCKSTCRALALSLLVLGLAFTGVSCSGGGGGGSGGGAAISVTGVTVDPALAAQGVLCLQVVVQGPPTTLFDMVASYVLLTGGSFVPLTEIPTSLGTSLGITSQGLMGHDTNTGQVTITFYWACGQDLGFLQPPPSVQIRFTPFTNGDPLNPNGAAFTTQPMLVDCGNPPIEFVNTTTQANRDHHTAHHVRNSTNPKGSTLENVFVAGGRNVATPQNALDDVRRLEFDRLNPVSPSVQQQFQQMFPGGVRRALHASSTFLDPTTGLIKVLVTGGVSNAGLPGLGAGPPNLLAYVQAANETDTTDIYSFDSVNENLASGPPLPSGPRFAHTATWTPGNRVVVIGGARGTNALNFTGLDSVDVYDPVTDTWSSSAAAMQGPRAEHTATLLGNGHVLVFGGYDPANPTVQPPIEIYDPVADSFSSVTAPGNIVTGRTHHTATRLMDGRVLITGGRDLNGNLLSQGVLIDGTTGVATAVPQDVARAEHTATLLGNGQVLITGGIAPTSPEAFTTTAVVFNPNLNTFTPVNPLNVSRAAHTATPGGSGSVYIVGGSNGTTASSFLLDLEFYAFSNAVPSVSMLATSTAASTNMLNVDFDVTDVDGDGGFAFLRWRQQGMTAWNPATIASQVTPAGAVLAPPSFQVTPGTNTFVWNFTSDAVAPGTTVELQVLPVGAVLGNPQSFLAVTP